MKKVFLIFATLLTVVSIIFNVSNALFSPISSIFNITLSSIIIILFWNFKKSCENEKYVLDSSYRHAYESGSVAGTVNVDEGVSTSGLGWVL